MPFFDGAGGAVYYKWWRSVAPCAAIVHLHGFGEHSAMYHRLGNTLNQAGIDLFALDQIGHGLTYGERGNVDCLESLVENGVRLIGLAAREAPGRPVVLMGHSLGSSVAAALAATRRPAIAGLILSASTFGADTVERLSQLEYAEDMDTSMESEALATDPFYLDELASDPLASASAPGAAASTSAVMPAAAAAVAQSRLPADLPVLMLHGTGDPVIPVSDARALAASTPGARLVEFDSLHDLLNDVKHHDVAATIAGFVRCLLQRQA